MPRPLLHNAETTSQCHDRYFTMLRLLHNAETTSQRHDSQAFTRQSGFHTTAKLSHDSQAVPAGGRSACRRQKGLPEAEGAQGAGPKGLKGLGPRSGPKWRPKGPKGPGPKGRAQGAGPKGLGPRGGPRGLKGLGPRGGPKGPKGPGPKRRAQGVGPRGPFSQENYIF